MVGSFSLAGGCRFHACIVGIFGWWRQVNRVELGEVGRSGGRKRVLELSLEQLLLGGLAVFGEILEAREGRGCELTLARGAERGVRLQLLALRQG